MFKGQGNKVKSEYDPSNPAVCGHDPTLYSHKFLGPVNNLYFRLYWNDIARSLHNC